MSIYFLGENGRELWNPASGVARIFHAQTEAMATILHVESGLGPIVSDEVFIQTEPFLKFASAFAQRMAATQHPALQALAGGTFAIVLGLLQAMGETPDRDDTKLESFVILGRELVRPTED